MTLEQALLEITQVAKGRPHESVVLQAISIVVLSIIEDRKIE